MNLESAISKKTGVYAV